MQQGADLHTAQLMPLPLTVSCFSKIQIGFTFLVAAYLGNPGKGPLNGCVCVCSNASCSVEANSSAELSPSARPFLYNLVGHFQVCQLQFCHFPSPRVSCNSLHHIWICSIRCLQNAQIPGNLFIEEDQLEKICSSDINT